MRRSTEIAWLAGLLEGEGCFYMCTAPRTNRVTRQPKIQVEMSDLDVLVRAKQLMLPGSKPPLRRKDRDPNLPGNREAGNHKQTWSFSVSGNTAVQWMVTLYPLLGERRQAKIRDVLEEWKGQPRLRVNQYK